MTKGEARTRSAVRLSETARPHTLTTHSRARERHAPAKRDCYFPFLRGRGVVRQERVRAASVKEPETPFPLPSRASRDQHKGARTRAPAKAERHNRRSETTLHADLSSEHGLDEKGIPGERL